MNTMSNAMTASLVDMPLSRQFGAYLAETRCEIRRYLRMPSFLLPVLLFPAVFYLMFGVLMSSSSDGGVARYLLGSYTTFGVMSPGLFGFGMSLALERDGGLITLKRALPMPPSAYLLGKLVMAMLAAATVSVLLMALAIGVGGVELSAWQCLRLLVTGILGVVPFCAMGMLIGTLVKGQAAPGVVNLIYLPMAFLSGLWIPLSMFPSFLQKAAPIWPSYHLNRIALDSVGFEQGALWPALLVLVGISVAMLGLAVRRLRRSG